MLFIAVLLLLAVVAGQNEFQVLGYLSRYGYLRLPLPERSNLDNEVGKALKDLQNFGGIPMSGLLDNGTQKLMTWPRCGDKDMTDGKGLKLKGSHWLPRNLTYQISVYPDCMSRRNAERVVSDALNVWSKHANVHFTPLSTGPVHMKIYFWKNQQNGPELVLSQSALDKFLGRVHIEYDTCCKGETRMSPIRLLEVVLHAVGHVLGLPHSTDPTSAMSPFRGLQGPVFDLRDSDIAAVQELYGRGREVDKNPMCKDPTLNAIFTDSEGQLILLRGEQFLEPSVHPNKPGKISERWVGLPGNLDAAFTSSSGLTYFFKGTQYWKYRGNRMDGHFPQPIATGFPGIPNRLDAAFIWDEDSSVYFFKGDEFWRFDPRRRPSVDLSQYPRAISNWHGVPNGLSAAVSFRGITYFFKSSKYYRFDNTNFKASLPRPLGPVWLNCKT